MKINNIIYGFTISILLLSMSCKNGENNSVASGVATIEVGLAESGFEGVDNVNFASMQRESFVQEDQHIYVPIGDGYSLSVLLSEDNPSSQSNQNGQTNTIVKKAVVERTPLGNNIRYKLVVFRSSGQYVLERNYVRGQESTAAPLLLDGGVTYTFVAYSVNSTTALPAIVFSNPANRTLATGSLQNVSAAGNTNYLMHYWSTFAPVGGRTTNLAVILVHKFSQVNATIDASALGLNITALNAHFDGQIPTANMTLTGSISYPGVPENKNFAFSTLNAQRVVSAPLMTNANLNTTNFVIRNITIGALNRTNIIIRNFEVRSGRKYNLTVRVNPTDIYFTDATTRLPVARIAGRVWARHNLGANTALDPDNTDANSSGLTGNYYQWGVRTIMATGSTSASFLTPWEPNVTNASNMWNTGTEANPVRNAAYDPCPASFRVPTMTDFQALVAATNSYNYNPNTFNNNNVVNNFRPLKLLVSRNNNNVRLSFPISGYRNWDNGSLRSRGSNGIYWSSTSNTPGSRFPLGMMNLTSTFPALSQGSDGKSFAYNIRCIRIQN